MKINISDGIFGFSILDWIFHQKYWFSKSHRDFKIPPGLSKSPLDFQNTHLDFKIPPWIFKKVKNLRLLIICKENHNFHLNYKIPPGFWKYPPGLSKSPHGFSQNTPWVFKNTSWISKSRGYLCWKSPLDFEEYHPGLSKIPPWIFKIPQNPWGDFKIQGGFCEILHFCWKTQYTSTGTFISQC